MMLSDIMYKLGRFFLRLKKHLQEQVAEVHEQCFHLRVAGELEERRHHVALVLWLRAALQTNPTDLCEAVLLASVPDRPV